jgi:hypothetical protein
MPAIVWVVMGLVVLVGALLAVDWFTAGLTRRRVLMRAKDQGTGNANAGYAVIENRAPDRR